MDFPHYRMLEPSAGALRQIQPDPNYGSDQSSLFACPLLFPHLVEQIEQDREDHACANCDLHEQRIVEPVASCCRVVNRSEQFHSVNQTGKQVSGAGGPIENEFLEWLNQPGKLERDAIDLAVNGTISVDNRRLIHMVEAAGGRKKDEAKVAADLLYRLCGCTEKAPVFVINALPSGKSRHRLRRIVGNIEPNSYDVE